MPLEIVTVPCRADNYAYLLRDEGTGVVALVDAPEAEPIHRTLKARGWALDLVLITHHHQDHVEGVEALRASTGAKVIGAEADRSRLPALDRAVREGDVVTVGVSKGEVIEVPGHTVGHIAYNFASDHALFSADSLMVMGCGRVFEGTPEMMWRSLGKLAALPPETRIFSGHEYAESNLRFALSLGSPDPLLAERAEAIRNLRVAGRPTVPATLAEERRTNPFLRAGDPAMKALLGMDGAPESAVFAEIRARKDRF